MIFKKDIVIGVTLVFLASGALALADQSTLPTSVTVAAPSPLVIQDHYRWRNDDGTESGASWGAAEDVASTTITANRNLRLRFQLDNTAGEATDYNYRLEWAAQGADNDCDTLFTNETYAAVPDVATTEHFDMVLSSNFADGDPTTAQLTTDSLTFVAGDMVESTSNQTGNITLANADPDEYTEVEYVFKANLNASFGSNYCFRVTNAGTALDQYDIVASTTLKASVVSVSNLSLNNNSDITLVEDAFKWASSTMLVENDSGCGVISSVDATVYLASTTNSGTTCSQDDNNCYPTASCIATTTGNTCGVDDTTVEYDCGFKLWYIAEPTDADGWDSSIWSVSATSSIGTATSTATNTAETIEINTLLAHDLVNGQVDYIFSDGTDVYWHELFGSGAVKIDDTSDFGTLRGADRNVARTSTGILYSAVNNAGSCEVWKSDDDGATWAEQDSTNNPGCTAGGNISAAIDSQDVLHLFYYDGFARHIPFNTVDGPSSPDTFGSEKNVNNSDTTDTFDIAVDSNDVPHVVYYQDGDNAISYDNRIGGSWNNSDVNVVVASASGTSLIINEDDIPEISYVDLTSSNVVATRGNQNDASSFTDTFDLDTSVNVTVGEYGTSIGVDSGGNTWVSYIDSDDSVALRKHNDVDAWTTWQAQTTNLDVGKEPSLAIDGTDVYIFYENDTNDIAYSKYAGSWTPEIAVETGTLEDANVRWSLNNNYGSGIGGNIIYGPLFTGTNTGLTNERVVVRNTGNAALDTQVDGDTMCTDYPTCASDTIDVAQQKYDLSDVAYGSLSFVLSGTPTTRETILPKPTSLLTAVVDNFFWGLNAPGATPVGNFSGLNTFTAVAD